jgi:hypothetical protein
LGYSGEIAKAKGNAPGEYDEGTWSAGVRQTPITSGLAAEVRKIPVATGVAYSGARGIFVGEPSLHPSIHSKSRRITPAIIHLTAIPFHV